MIFARKGFSLARTKKEYSRKVNQMKRTIALCLALIMALGLLAGCNQTGTEKDPGTTPDGMNQGTNQGTAEQSEKTLIMRAESAFTTLDPANSNNTHDIKLNDQIYEGLYGMNEASGGYYKELAKDVQVSDDSLVYTITLQDGVTFQNGETLTASDCVFTYERAMTFAAMNYLTTMIESVEAPDDQTFVIKMKYAYAPLAHTLFRIKILEEGEVTAQGDKFGTIPNTAGTGAYYVKEYDVASGAKERTVIWKHALKNALLPVITNIGLNMGGLIMGAVVAERLFSVPGIGALIVDRIAYKDEPVIIAGTIVISITFTIIMLAVDIIYAFVDPRIRAKYTKVKG